MKHISLAVALMLVPATAFAGGERPPHTTPNPPAPSTPVTVNSLGQQQGQAQFQGQQQGQGQSQSSRNTNRNRNTAKATNAGVTQSVNFRDYRQAPSVSAAFSGGPTAPCERNPLGIGGSSAVPNPFSFLLQIPLSSTPCWKERNLQMGLSMRSQGIRISDNALIAVWAGNDVGTAVRNNPYLVPAYAPVHRVQRTHRKRVSRCGC